MLWWNCLKIQIGGTPARYGAVQRLGDYRSLNAGAIRLLLGASENDPWENTRIEALKSLDKILASGDSRTRQAVASIANPSVFERLSKLVLEEAILVRSPVLRLFLKHWDSSDPATGKPVADLVSSPETVAGLVGMYKRRDDSLHAVLLKIDRQAVLKALEDSFQAGNQATVAILAAVSGPEAFEKLLPLAKSSNAETRADVIQALGDRDDPRADDLLLAGLADEDENVRLMAQTVLKRLTRTPTSQGLIIEQAILSDDWERVVGLGASAVEPLHRALSECTLLADTLPIMRAMGKLKDPRSVTAIAPLVEELIATGNVLHEMMQRSAAGELSLTDLHTIPRSHKLSRRCHSWFLFEILGAVTKGHQAGNIDYKASRIPFGALLPHLQNFVALLVTINEILGQLEQGPPPRPDGTYEPMDLEKLQIQAVKERVVEAITRLSPAESPAA